MTTGRNEDGDPEDSGVVAEQTSADPDELAVVAATPVGTVYQTKTLSTAISGQSGLVRNHAARALLMYGVEHMERVIDKQDAELRALRAELRDTVEKKTETMIQLRTCQQVLANARREQNAASALITIGMLLLGAAVELRGERIMVWLLFGGIGSALSLYGWFGFREHGSPKGGEK